MPIDPTAEPPVELSIVIGTRNRAAALAETLRALALIRSKYAFEIVLVDNASTDATAEVIRQADDGGGRLRYVFEGDPGLGAAHDTGWRAARGRIIAFTDDDCYPDPTYADAVVEAFQRRPEAGCIGGRILLHDPDDLPVTIDLREAPVRYAPREFVGAGSLHGANLSFRRSALEASGGVDRFIGTGTAFQFEDIDCVAAVIWLGMPAWFDPAPVVRHHHRRRGQEALHRLFLGYDHGRGAYYAKYILRPDSRAAYLRAWWGITSGYWTRHGLVRFGRELRAFLAYLRFRKAYLALAASVPLGALCYAGFAALISLRIVRKRWNL